MKLKDVLKRIFFRMFSLSGLVVTLFIVVGIISWVDKHFPGTFISSLIMPRMKQAVSMLFGTIIIGGSILYMLKSVSRRFHRIISKLGRTILGAPTTTIVGLYAHERAEQYFFISISLSLILVVYTAFSFIFGFEIDILVTLIIAGLILAVAIHQNVLEYRISRGFYGTNEYEAREILNFILSHADKSNFNDKGNLKVGLADQTVKEIYKSQTVPGAEGAQA